MEVHSSGTAQRILASASSEGHQYQLLEDPVGGLSIAIDNVDAVTYRWPPEQIESCMSVFLGMLRHRVVSH